jgi:hypothetical protein
MAEAIGIIGSILAVANSAATLSRALFDFVETIKNARKEIAYIAQQLSFLSGSLNTLADVISSQQDLFKAALYSNTKSILGQYRLGDGLRQVGRGVECRRHPTTWTLRVQEKRVLSMKSLQPTAQIDHSTSMQPVLRRPDQKLHRMNLRLMQGDTVAEKRKSNGKQRQQQAGFWTNSSKQEQDYQTQSANKSSAEYMAMPSRHGTVSGHDRLFGLPLPPSNPFDPNGFTHHYNPQQAHRRSDQEGMGSDIRNAQPSTWLHNPESHWPFSASHPNENLPMSMKAPPPPPPAPSHVFTRKDEIEAEMLAREITDKEDAVLAAVMKLLDKGERQHTANVDDPRFTKMLQLLITQHEQQAQFGLEQARVVAEAEMKLILAARDKDDADIRRLEKVITQQGKEQRKVEAMWRAERVAQEEKAAEQAREVKALMERDIEAARKALKHAKAEAEKKAEAEAESEQRIKKEKQDFDDKFRELGQRYEKALDIKAARQLQAYCNGGYPVRRTFMSNGDRSMEVAEYAATTRELHSGSSLRTAAFFQEDIPC